MCERLYGAYSALWGHVGRRELRGVWVRSGSGRRKGLLVSAVVDAVVEPSRLRRVALLLMAWGLEVPVARSRPLGVRGRGERVGASSMSEREIGLVLDRLADEEVDAEAGSIVELAVERDLRRGSHPAFARLGAAMEELRLEDERAWRLLRWAFVGRSGMSAVVRLHAACYVASVREGSLRLSEAGAIFAGLIRLGGLLGDVGWPRVVREQEESWERWLAAVRPKHWTDGEGTTRRLHPAALALRDQYVRELRRLGLSQVATGKHVGLSDRQVRNVEARVRDVTEEFAFQDSPARTREFSRELVGSDQRPWWVSSHRSRTDGQRWVDCPRCEWRSYAQRVADQDWVVPAICDGCGGRLAG